MVAAIRPHVEHEVSVGAGELIASPDEVWEQVAAEYRPMMEMIATSLSPGFTTSAVQRRRQIAGVMPDMRPMPEPVKKSRRQKGGDQ
jgi:hypothetical protein